MIDQILALDRKLFLFLNSFHTDTWDTIMWWISDKEFWYPLYGIFIVYIIWKYRWNSILTLIFIAILITLADQSSVKLFKEVFERFRPCRPESPIHELVHIVNGHCGGMYGFVSSHAANSLAAATFLFLLFRNKYFSWFIFIWAAVVAYSRVYLGVHYPLDIIGGALLGIGIGHLVFWIYRKTGNRFLKGTFYG